MMSLVRAQLGEPTKSRSPIGDLLFVISFIVSVPVPPCLTATRSFLLRFAQEVGDRAKQLSVVLRREITKIRSFEAEQAQARKTTIFSGVSMTAPSPTSRPLPLSLRDIPLAVPRGGVNERAGGLGSKYDAETVVAGSLLRSPLAITCRCHSPALARLCQLALWAPPLAKTIFNCFCFANPPSPEGDVFTTS